MPNIPVDTSHWPSREALQERIKGGFASRESLAAELNCSRTRIGRYLRGENAASQAPVDDDERTAQSDVAFIEAMRAAIQSGAEKAAIGIKTDSSPLVPKRFSADMIMSGSGSPAAMCSMAAGGMAFTKS